MDDPTDGAALKFMKRYLEPVGWAAGESGMILQTATNQAHHTYAGTYALVTYLSTVDNLLNLAYLSPAITGRHNAKAGLPVSALVIYPFIVINMWQAWTLPKIEQSKAQEDEDDE
jgi:hypothetical protein